MGLARLRVSSFLSTYMHTTIPVTPLDDDIINSTCVKTHMSPNLTTTCYLLSLRAYHPYVQRTRACACIYIYLSIAFTPYTKYRQKANISTDTYLQKAYCLFFFIGCYTYCYTNRKKRELMTIVPSIQRNYVTFYIFSLYSRKVMPFLCSGDY